LASIGLPWRVEVWPIANTPIRRWQEDHESRDLLMRKTSLAVVSHVGPAPRGDKISAPHALAALAALGQPTRLAIFRLLMRREPNGLAAGAIAQSVGSPHNTLSTHLSILARSGLVHGTRDSRSIVYRANIEGMRALVAFLINDCCDGHPEVCNFVSVLQETGCCAPVSKSNQGNNRRRK
jgi:ArsR family transcriptional regulator